MVITYEALTVSWHNTGMFSSAPCRTLIRTIEIHWLRTSRYLYEHGSDVEAALLKPNKQN